MTTFENVWRKLSQGKKYREHFALAFLKRSVPFQIKILRKRRCGSQAVLAVRAGLTQGVVSRAEDQDYGNLTLNTVGKIASGLDMAFVGRFVPFSTLVRFSSEMSEEMFSAIPVFDEENVIPCLSEQLQPPVPQLGNIEDVPSLMDGPPKKPSQFAIEELGSLKNDPAERQGAAAEAAA